MIQVGGFVNYHRRIARTACKDPFAGFGSEFHHAMPAGDGDHVDLGMGHQVLRGGDVRLCNRGETVRRPARRNNRLIDIFNHPGGNDFGFWMGVVDHCIAAGQHHNGVVNNTRRCIGDGVYGGDYPHRYAFIDGDAAVAGKYLRFYVFDTGYPAGGLQFKHRAGDRTQIRFFQFHPSVFFAVGPPDVPNSLDDFFPHGQWQRHQLLMRNNGSLDGVFHFLKYTVGTTIVSTGRYRRFGDRQLFQHFFYDKFYLFFINSHVQTS